MSEDHSIPLVERAVIARSRIANRRYGASLFPSPAQVLAGLAVTAVAAGAGWLVAAQVGRVPGSDAAETPVAVAVGAARVTLNDRWRPVAGVPRVPGLDGAAARAFQRADGGDGRLVVTLLGRASGSLPAATVAALRVPPPAPRRATIASLRASEYPALPLHGVGGLADVYTVPTGAGLVAVTCLAPVADPLPTDSCPGDVISITAPGDPAAALRAKAPALLAELDRARVKDRAALHDARTPAAQAAAARALSHAYARAAARVAAVAPRSGAGAALPGAFRAAAAAYRRLAIAGAQRDRRAWRRAQAAVSAAERQGATSLAELRATAPGGP
jgi:hypothetical protein